jgi:hypothetical protein
MLRSSPRLFGRVAAALAVITLVAGCVSSATYHRLLLNSRESSRETGSRVECLSRENKVLYEAKLGLEKELTLADNKAQSVQAQLDAQTEDHDDYRESAERKMKELELDLKTLREKASKRILEVSRQKLAAVDSLEKRIDSISSRCAASRRDFDLTVRRLKDELAEKEFERAKETYALTRIKDELFSKLEENERTIARLRDESNRLFAKIAADSMRAARVKRSGPKS